LRRIIDKNDIDSEFKEIITKAFNEKTADNRSFLELAYLAQIDNIDENLQKISKGNLNERFADSPEWAARLILCKNGKFPLSNIIKAIESAPELYRVTVLFADLKDFKDPETINYLKNYLNSDKRLPGLKPTVPREPLARFIPICIQRYNNYIMPFCKNGGWRCITLPKSRWMKSKQP